jgi:single-strand DNA-binding protein
MGNVGQTPEIRFSNGGMAIAEISLATNDRKKQGNEWVKDTQWHKVVVFGKRAEFVQNHVHKGATLLVEGKIQYDKYEKDGETKYFTKILASNLQFAGRKQEATATQPMQQQESKEVPFDDDDIPF